METGDYFPDPDPDSAPEQNVVFCLPCKHCEVKAGEQALAHDVESTLYAIARPSVCPFVTGVDQSKRFKLGLCNFHLKQPHPSSFCRINFIQRNEFSLSGATEL